MDHPARLPIDCPRCEKRGHIDFGDDDVRLPCPLCNNWCALCLEVVPTFVPITRPYRGSLIAGMRPPADGETLFEGYACDYHKATLKSYSYIAPPMVGRFQAGQAYLAAQGRVSSYATAMERHETGRSLKMRLGRPLVPTDTRPMGRSSIPVQWSWLSKHDADLA